MIYFFYRKTRLAYIYIYIYNCFMANSGISSIKCRKYTFALSNPSQWESVIDIVEGFPGYAYIKHDKDNGSVHYHFYIEFPNPRSLHSVAQELNLPDSMIEKVRCPEGLLKYLTHSDNKSIQAGKYQYSRDDITTNLPDSAFEGPEDWDKMYDEIVDIVGEYGDGNLSYRQMMVKLKPFLRGCRPTSIVRHCFDVNAREVTTSDNYPRVPFSGESIETPFGTARNLGLSKSSEFHVPRKLTQQKILSDYPT